MSRRDSVNGIVVVRDLDAVSGQLVTKSYRPRPSHRRSPRQLGHAFGQRLGPADERLPEALAGGGVEGGEDLAAEAVEDREPLALGTLLSGDPAGERVEGADAARRQPACRRQAARRRDPDPHPGEGPGPEADGDPVDGAPATGGGRGRLDLGQQRGCVPRAPGRREPELGLVQQLTVAPAAGGGVDGRGVEADDDQRGSASQSAFRAGQLLTRKTKVPTRLPLTNQLTWWRPGIVEVILFT